MGLLDPDKKPGLRMGQGDFTETHLKHLFCHGHAQGLTVYRCTLWLFNIAMENEPFIDDVPIKGDDFPWLC